MSNKLRVMVCSLLILVAGAAGALSAPAAKAVVVDGYVWMNPGATNSMTYGWHGDCDDTPTSGVALDWSNSGGASVYFRGFGATLTGTGGAVGTGQAFTSNNGCYRIRLEIRDPAGTFRASGLYTHTDQPQGGTFTIAGGSLGSPGYTSVVIGKTRSSEMMGCPWTAAHLHQYGEDFGSRNTGTYPTYVNAGTYTATSISNWITADSYSWSE
jgi:hypothetical protein